MRLSERRFLWAIVLLAILLRLPSFFCDVWSIDEAAMAAAATLVAEDGVLYRDAVDHHAPLTEYIYAATFRTFGNYNMLAVRLVQTGMIVVVVLTVYALGRWTVGRRGALLAALLMAMLASFAYTTHDMYAFHTEWTVILFTSLGAWLLVRGVLGGRLAVGTFAGGLCFGLAVFSKQPAAFDFLAALAFLGYLAVLAARGRWPGGVAGVLKTAVLLIAGVATVSLGVAAFFFFTGAWEDFVFQFYTYNTKYYVASVPLVERILRIRFAFLDVATPFNLGALALMGAVLVSLGFFGDRPGVSRRRHRGRVFLMFWAVGSFAGVAIAGRSFAHYYIQILPPWCLLGGLTLQYFSEIVDAAAARAARPSARRIWATSWLLMALLIAMPAAAAQKVGLLLRHFTDKDPAVTQTAEYIRRNSGEDEKIFVWGFLPEVYVASDRMPASRYVFCNWLTGLIPWTNCDPGIDTSDKIVPGSWANLMADLEENRPVFIVDTTPGDYRRYVKYPIEKFPLLDQFVAERYELVGEFPSSSREVMIRLYRARPSPVLPEKEG